MARDATLAVKIIGDAKSAVRALSATSAATAAMSKQTAAMSKQTGRDTGRASTAWNKISGALLNVGKALPKVTAIGTIGISSAASIPAVIGLAGAIGQLSGLALAAPAAIGVAAAAIGVFKLATSGIGDAIKASSPEELAKAMKGMPPAAREAVTAIRSLGPAWSGLKTIAQQNFFKDLAGPIKETSAVLLPQMQAGVGKVSAAWNVFAKAGLEGIRAFAGTGALTKIFDATANAIKGASGALKPLGEALGTLVGVGAADVGNLGQKFTDLANRFNNWVQKASKSGQLAGALSQAKVVAQQLAGAIGSVARILGGVFSAAGPAGGAVGQMLKAIADTVNGPAFQQGLKGFFDGINDGFKAIQGVLPVIGQAFGALGPLVGELARQAGPLLAEVLRAIGESVKVLAPALMPVVTALGQSLLPVFKQLSATIPQAITALLPLMPTLTSLARIIGTVLSVAVSIFANWVKFLTPVISAVAPVINWVAGAIEGLINWLAPAIVWVTDFSGVWDTIGGVFTTVVGWFTGFFGNLGALWGKIKELFSGGVAGIVSFLAGLPGKAVGALAALGTMLWNLVSGAFGKVVAAVTAGVAAAVAFIATLPGKAVAALASLAGRLFSTATGAFGRLKSAVTSGVAAAVTFIATLPGKAVAALASLAGRLFSTATAAFGRLKSAVTTGISNAVSLVAGLPGKAAGALLNVGSALANAGKNLIGGFINGIKSKIPDVKGALGGLTSKLTSWKGPPEKDRILLRRPGQLIMDGFVKSILDSRSNVRAALADVTTLVERGLDGTKAVAAIDVRTNARSGSTGGAAAAPVVVNVAFNGLVTDPDAVAREIEQLLKRRNLMAGQL